MGLCLFSAAFGSSHRLCRLAQPKRVGVHSQSSEFCHPKASRTSPRDNPKSQADLGKEGRNVWGQRKAVTRGKQCMPSGKHWAAKENTEACNVGSLQTLVGGRKRDPGGGRDKASPVWLGGSVSDSASPGGHPLAVEGVSE